MSSYYGGDIDAKDLMDLSTSLGCIAVGKLDDDLAKYEALLAIVCGDDNSYLSFVAKSNLKSVKNFKDKYPDIYRELAAIKNISADLKKAIDTYINHVASTEVRSDLMQVRNDIRRVCDEQQEQISDLVTDEDCLLRQQAMINRANVIADWRKKQMEEDVKHQFDMVKRRQWLRSRIKACLEADANMKGQDIADAINKSLEELPENFPVRMTVSRQDVYSEWNDVRAQMEAGTFGTKYPDNVSDDYETAVKTVVDLDD